MDYDASFIHGVTHGILSVSLHLDNRAVQISPQRIAGGPGDVNMLAAEAASNISLSAAVFHCHFCPVSLPDLLV